MIERIRRSFADSVECPHGGKVLEAAASLGSEPLDFSANINPLGMPSLKEVFAAEIERLGHYPDNKYTEFRKAAGAFVGLDAKNIVPGNGSSEIIRLFAETTLSEGEDAIIPFPTFGEYETQSRLFGANIIKADLGSSGQVKIDDPILRDSKAFFLCNPNNPTGRLLPAREVADLARRCERYETFILVDEAFIELSDPDQSIVKLAPELNYLVVMRSLTKSFGVPGLRLGFGVTNCPLAEIMNRARTPWSISSIAAASAVELFKHTDHLEKARRLIKTELIWLTGQLLRLGLKPLESVVNFILVDISPAGISSEKLCRRMMAEGILIRDCQSFGLGDRFIRIAVRNRDENVRLVSALERSLCTG